MKDESIIDAEIARATAAAERDALIGRLYREYGVRPVGEWEVPTVEEVTHG